MHQVFVLLYCLSSINAVYSVNPTNSLAYTIQKILASTCSLFNLSSSADPFLQANAHRVFLTRENGVFISPTILPTSPGNLSGIVSVVDSQCRFCSVVCSVAY